MVGLILMWCSKFVWKKSLALATFFTVHIVDYEKHERLIVGKYMRILHGL